MTRNRKIWIIAAAVLVVGCCMCIFFASAFGFISSISRQSSEKSNFKGSETEHPGEQYSSEDSEPDLSETNIPSEMTFYNIRLVGNGFEDFDRSGCLIVSPTISAPGNQNNGSNPLEVGITSGNPSLGSAGAIWWVSNTQLLCNVLPASCRTQSAALDVAKITLDKSRGLVTAEAVGPSQSMTTQLNIFNARSGLTANVYQVIQGALQIEFQPDGNIQGQVNFKGRGMISGGSATYQAEFTGEITDSCE
jgi:hypothetical protein